jgi:hypothetical protein
MKNLSLVLGFIKSFSKREILKVISPVLYMIVIFGILYLVTIWFSWDIENIWFKLLFYVFSTIFVVLIGTELANYRTEKNTDRIIRENKGT